MCVKLTTFTWYHADQICYEASKPYITETNKRDLSHIEPCTVAFLPICIAKCVNWLSQHCHILHNIKYSSAFCIMDIWTPCWPNLWWIWWACLHCVTCQLMTWHDIILPTSGLNLMNYLGGEFKTAVHLKCTKYKMIDLLLGRVAGCDCNIPLSV